MIHARQLSIRLKESSILNPARAAFLVNDVVGCPTAESGMESPLELDVNDRQVGIKLTQ